MHRVATLSRVSIWLQVTVLDLPGVGDQDKLEVLVIKPAEENQAQERFEPARTLLLANRDYRYKYPPVLEAFCAAAKHYCFEHKTKHNL